MKMIKRSKYGHQNMKKHKKELLPVIHKEHHHVLFNNSLLRPWSSRTSMVSAVK